MITIRNLTSDDLAAVTRIYTEHVLSGTATFEEVPPTPTEMTQRSEKVQAMGLPFLVAQVEGEVAGYAYASLFHQRSAYRFTLEDSVYIDPAYHRRGAGRQLLTEVIVRCEALGYRQMIAAIGDSGNHASIGLHRSLGFRDVGAYRSVGLKFGRWLDVVLMQRSLGGGDQNVPV